MKLGIIGTGNVGGALGKLWAKHHEIVFGVRDPQKPEVRALVGAIGARACAGTVKDAAAADVVVLAVPWPGAHDAIKAAGDLTGKILVDCTNPLASDLSGLVIGHTTSAAEEVARWAPGAKVVKAFNTIGAPNFGQPSFDSLKASMFICGDDPAAKSVVSGLAAELGFEVVDSGPLANARLLEPLAMLWIYLAIRGGMGPASIGFKLLRR